MSSAAVVDSKTTQTTTPEPRAPTQKTEGPLKLHDIFLIDPRSDSHSSREWWCKVAAYAEYALIGIIALTGFVLTTVYAPAFIPTVSILIIGCLIGADKLHNMFMEWAGNYAQKHEEDAYVEDRLRAWGKRAFSETLYMNRSFLKHSLNTSPETILKNPVHSKHAKELNILSTLFARLRYQHSRFEAAETELEKIAMTFDKKGLDFFNTTTIIDKATTKGQVIPTDAKRNLRIINSDLIGLDRRMNIMKENMAHAKATCALYLYLLQNPTNTFNTNVSSLTWESILQHSIISEEDPGSHEFLRRPIIRLPFGKQLTTTSVLDNNFNDLAHLIHKEVTSHLAAAEHFAATKLSPERK